MLEEIELRKQITKSCWPKGIKKPEAWKQGTLSGLAKGRFPLSHGGSLERQKTTWKILCQEIWSSRNNTW